MFSADSHDVAQFTIAAKDHSIRSDVASVPTRVFRSVLARSGLFSQPLAMATEHAFRALSYVTFDGHYIRCTTRFLPRLFTPYTADAI